MENLWDANSATSKAGSGRNHILRRKQGDHLGGLSEKEMNNSEATTILLSSRQFGMDQSSHHVEA